MKRISIVMILGVLLALLSACAGDIPDVQSNAGQQQAVPSATPTSTPVQEMQDDGDQQSPPEPSATPTVKPGLEATDPESVELVSGKPTLLEFFAFW